MSDKDHLYLEKKNDLIPWTDAQNKVVTEFFSAHIRNKKPPKKSDCQIVKDNHPELLNNKDWLKIKVFVQNKYRKN